MIENIHIVGFAAHIFHHSGVYLSDDILPLDIEAIVHKTFQYFHIYTVGFEDWKGSVQLWKGILTNTWLLDN